MMLNFWVNQRLFYTLASGGPEPSKEALPATRCVRSPRSGASSCGATMSSILAD